MAQPRYQVIERIDAGGMAEVFKANATSMQGFQKLVAIKRVLPSLTKNERFVRMFLDEAKVSLHLNHTNCVQVFDLGIADGTYFIVMEFVDGVDLKKILQYMSSNHEMMPVEQAVHITIEVCKGLAHAHSKRDMEGMALDIVHRDISPPNVLLSREGEVKITDFGLAKAQSQVDTTDPGVVKGKFGYLSPEAANGESVDLRTDVFAVGILLWEMLIGRRLFLGKTDYDTLRQVQAAQIPSISDYRSDVPHQLEQIIAKGLARDPERRYQDAYTFANDLTRFLFSLGRPVTSFDIADMVQRVKGNESKRADDAAVNAVVQQEINKLVSLEEVDDLDLYLADAYAFSDDDSGPSNDHDASLEDPASWAIDLDLGDADDAPSFLADAVARTGDTWQNTALSDLISRDAVMAAQKRADSMTAQAATDSDSTSVMTSDELPPQRMYDDLYEDGAAHTDPTTLMSRQHIASSTLDRDMTERFDRSHTQQVAQAARAMHSGTSTTSEAPVSHHAPPPTSTGRFGTIPGAGSLLGAQPPGVQSAPPPRQHSSEALAHPFGQEGAAMMSEQSSEEHPSSSTSKRLKAALLIVLALLCAAVIGLGALIALR